MTNPEKDLRLNLLNTLLTTPHRQLENVWPVHDDLVKQDPRFYVRLAAWYADHGDVRDHKEMFIVTLILSDFPGHRDVGLAMLRGLPPYQVVRVVDFISGRKKKVRVTPAATPEAAKGKTKKARKTQRKALVAAGATGETKVIDYGLFRNPPRALRTEVTRYLREREADADWFDSSVLVARKALKRLYALLHIAPSERAQKILFDRDPPEDSRVHALPELAKAKDPKQQAKAIVKHQIPYRVAATVIGQMTPEILRALVECMTSQELINNLASLKRHGAMKSPELKALIERKLEEARTDTRVSALKASEAIKAADVSAEVRQKLEAVADAHVKAKGRITRSTALLVDKSGSMQPAIDLGKRIGALLSTVCEGGLYVYAFDSMAYPIESGGDDLASWERAFAGVTANGNTSCGVALELMRRKRQRVEQIILVSDQEENTPPLFVDTLRKYCTDLTAEPNVCFVRTPGGKTQLEDACHRAGIQADAFQFSGDYYSLPNLIPLLARPSKLELLLEIMEYPLPERKRG